jgi:hypothetical protein
MRFIASPRSPSWAARRFHEVLATSGREPLQCLFLILVEKATGARPASG